MIVDDINLILMYFNDIKRTHLHDNSDFFSMPYRVRP
jgi:hypothetical protein